MPPNISERVFNLYSYRMVVLYIIVHNSYILHFMFKYMKYTLIFKRTHSATNLYFTRQCKGKNIFILNFGYVFCQLEDNLIRVNASKFLNLFIFGENNIAKYFHWLHQLFSAQSIDRHLN